MIEVRPELLAFLREEYDRCRDETLEDERETAIDRYNGEPYGDEEDGRSQVVARDTAETTDYMVISILRTIVSGDRVVEFVHKNSDAADEATETVMHILMDEQDGYTVLHDWLKAGLLEKNAVAMAYGEPQPPKRIESTVSVLAMMAAEQQGIKLIEAEEAGEDEQGLPMFKVAALQPQPPKFCIDAVPNEEFYCSPDARTIDSAALKGRRVRKSVSELIEMGHERDEVEAISGDTGHDNTLSNSRDEDRYADQGARRGAARMVWWHEEYARFDANGDGIAETLYIQRSADFKVFSIEEVEADEHPYEDWCPFPMQHRRVGQSLADKVMDIERVRTVLLRQSLDGIYLANNPAIYVHEDAIGENTIEDLLTVRPGAIRRWRGNIQPMTQQDRFDPGAGFQMLEFMNGERESRTGITRLNQGLDADTLNKTATGTALMQAQGQQVEEYLARNFANALARLFTKLAKLLKRYGQSIEVPIDGEFKQVNPANWPEDMIARPRVGLGAGRKDQRLLYRRELIEYQRGAMEMGLPIVDARTFFNSAKGFVADAGLGDVTEFFNDPETMPPQPEKPDPEMEKVQAEIQAKQAEMQMKAQSDQANLQLETAKAQAKLQADQQAAMANIELARAKAQADAQLAREKASFEAELAAAKMQFEQRLAEQKMAVDAQIQAKRADNDREAKMSQNRSGGDLSK